MKITSEKLIDTIAQLYKFKEKYNKNLEEIEKMEASTDDLLHEIELSPEPKVKFLYELKKVRVKRRKLIDENTRIQPIKEYLDKYNHFESDLKGISNLVQRREKQQENRLYRAKVRKDLTIPQVRYVEDDNVS